MTHVTGQGIGWAVKQLWHGEKIRRVGWNGKSMWLALQAPDMNSRMTLPFVYMRTAQGDLVPWLCSQTDLLAADWEIAHDAVRTPLPRAIGLGEARDGAARTEAEAGAADRSAVADHR
jgi:Protein of unknown function (DUF2829)